MLKRADFLLAEARATKLLCSGTIDMPLAELHEIRPLEGVKVLLADDDAEVQHLYSTALSRAGADVAVASDGEAAFLLWERTRCSVFPFDIVVLDYAMMGYDGGTVTGLMRDAGFNGPIIGVSAVLDPDEFRRWKTLGCDHVFEKSISLPELIRQVAAAAGPAITEPFRFTVAGFGQGTLETLSDGVDEASLQELKADVIVENREWINAHPYGTLGQLRERMELAVQQCWQQASHEDGPVRGYGDLPEPLASELRLWPLRGEDGRPKTFSDRAVELEGFLSRVVRLIGHTGPDFIVSRLISSRGSDFDS